MYNVTISNPNPITVNGIMVKEIKKKHSELKDDTTLYNKVVELISFFSIESSKNEERINHFLSKKN